MSRTLTSRSSLESLRREAKRWLRQLRDGDPDAVARFHRWHPTPPSAPALRDVQLALARELDFPVAHNSERRMRGGAGRRHPLTGDRCPGKLMPARRMGRLLSAAREPAPTHERFIRRFEPSSCLYISGRQAHGRKVS